MYVCICHAVTEKQLRKAIAEGSDNVRDLRRQLGVVSSCGKCGHCVREMVKQSQQTTTSDVASIARPAFS